jgi:hypothetical protein
MADAFVKQHLLNPSEFWTPMPLPSLSVGEPLFKNNPWNDWSGQPQGLTYQRVIRALENYGHYAEVTLLGRKLLAALIRNGCKFPQQFDPFTGEGSPGQDGYGPTLLGALEYLSRMHGIYLDMENGQVWWSALAGSADFTYAQRWGENVYALECRQGKISARLNNDLIFTSDAGARIITGLNGQIQAVVGIDSETKSIKIKAKVSETACVVAPNEKWLIDGSKVAQKYAVPFNYPFST